ncbi:MAG: type II toxin-antitoxin system RelE/ParE family toxin [Candidatus Symbiobacter sp.]|nr:type II toxin-antitoxin system RelE/ParE family toxin [Candidatus Symbiobacter sp.]
MRIYKTKWLAKFAKSEQISNITLKEAIDRAERGLVDADLGGGLIKQRVARMGQGRSGGFRTIIAYKAQERAVFLYAFAKNERENLTLHELTDLRRIGKLWLEQPIDNLLAQMKDGKIEEIDND